MSCFLVKPDACKVLLNDVFLKRSLCSLSTLACVSLPQNSLSASPSAGQGVVPGHPQSYLHCRGLCSAKGSIWHPNSGDKSVAENNGDGSLYCIPPLLPSSSHGGFGICSSECMHVKGFLAFSEVPHLGAYSLFT